MKAAELRWPCGRCSRTDSVYLPAGADVVVCLACGYEESAVAAARRRFGHEGPALVDLGELALARVFDDYERNNR